MAQMSMCGESACADPQSSRDWRTKVLPHFIRHFYRNDVFNADETGIFLNVYSTIFHNSNYPLTRSESTVPRRFELEKFHC